MSDAKPVARKITPQEAQGARKAEVRGLVGFDRFQFNIRASADPETLEWLADNDYYAARSEGPRRSSRPERTRSLADGELHRRIGPAPREED